MKYQSRSDQFIYMTKSAETFTKHHSWVNKQNNDRLPSQKILYCFISLVTKDPRQSPTVWNNFVAACSQIIVSNDCAPYNQKRISGNQFFNAEVDLKIIIQTGVKAASVTRPFGKEDVAAEELNFLIREGLAVGQCELVIG